MTEPSVEELIAGFERHATEAEAGGYIYAEFEVDIAAMRALIASWRVRGEALKGANLAIELLSNAYDIAREALKKMQARYEGVQKTMSTDDLQQAYDSMKP